MRRFIVACALVGILGAPAKADETLKWRHVQHSASRQTQEVGDVNGHTLNLFRLPGIAFLPDGSVGTTLVIGTSDVVNGAATLSGYYTLRFNDGSELWFKYTGTAEANSSSKGTNPQRGTATVIGGKGRYAGAKGDGTWEGNSTPPGPEYVGYIDNVFNIKN
jgi:hypothetical protein